MYEWAELHEFWPRHLMKYAGSFMLRPLYSRGSSPRYPLDRWIDEPQSRSRRRGEEKNLFLVLSWFSRSDSPCLSLSFASRSQSTPSWITSWYTKCTGRFGTQATRYTVQRHGQPYSLSRPSDAYALEIGYTRFRECSFWPSSRYTDWGTPFQSYCHSLLRDVCSGTFASEKILICLIWPKATAMECINKQKWRTFENCYPHHVRDLFPHPQYIKEVFSLLGNGKFTAVPQEKHTRSCTELHILTPCCLKIYFNIIPLPPYLHLQSG
jgi:hypothetical protein